MAEHVDREGAGHLHAHFAHGPAAIAYLTHLVTGVPFSFTAHAKDLYTTPPAYVAQRGRAAEFVVTCTEANRAYLRKLLGPGGDKVIVCRHGVDVERFSAVVRRPVPGRILSIGRLVQKKGFDVLVRALAVLAERGVAFECRVVGDGPLAEELQALARTVGIDRHVAFLGARPQVELLAEYGAAEVFALAPVITSDGDRDGIPNVLAEAMASGLPVVSAAVSGIPELIHHGDTGVLVPPSDPPALADALQELLIDPAEGSRLGEAARRWVAMNWDLRDAVAPLAELFAERLGMRSMAGA